MRAEVAEDGRMRGRRNPQITMLAFIDLEERVPTAHPLRTIKWLADEALTDLSSTFDAMYAKNGRTTIPARGAGGSVAGERSSGRQGL